MRKTILTLLAFVVTVGFASAQEVPTPEFKNTPVYLKPDGTLEKLEKQTTAIKDKGSNGYLNSLTYGATANKSMQYINCTGNTATISVPTTAIFVVKLTDAETDPDGTFILTEAVVVKKMREVYIKKDMGRNVQEKQITLTYEKVAPGVYKILPDHLNPGTEYCFVPNTSNASKIVSLFKTEGTASKKK